MGMARAHVEQEIWSDLSPVEVEPHLALAGDVACKASRSSDGDENPCVHK